MLPYIDIHAHVNFAAYDGDRNEVVERALSQGVAMINVGTQQDTAKKAVEIAESYDKGVYAIIGVHPIHTDKSYHDKKELGEEGKEFTSRGEAFDYDFYKSLAGHPKVVGIGECGLDYYRTEPSSEEKQRKAFLEQIALANEFKKPLMLHVRNGGGRSAYRDALEMLKAESKVKANFHFFAGDIEEAREILDAGFFVSFTGVITFARDYDEVIRFVPLDRLMSETDCPYVTPSPYRGKRNEPSYVTEVVRAVSSIKGVEFDKAADALYGNAKAFFGL